MARIEAALYAKLVSVQPLAALVADRIYPVTLPEGVTYPAVRYQRISANRVQTLTGPSGLTNTRFQIDAFGQGDEAYLEAGQIAEQIRIALDGFSGKVADVDIQGLTLLAERDGEFTEGLVKTVSQEFQVWHQEE